MLSPGGSGYFTCIQNMKLVTSKFKSGGLHEKHVETTWNVGNHLCFCCQVQSTLDRFLTSPLAKRQRPATEEEGNYLE